MLILAVLICGCFGQLMAVPRTCSKEDYCLPVPAEVCDNSLCVPFDWDQLALFGDPGMKFNTWNIGEKALLGYCPAKFTLEQFANYDGSITENAIFSMDSGPYCNVTTGYMNHTYTAKPDPYTGKYTTFTIHKAGDKYEVCYLYMDPGVANIFRSCRVDPPPAPGQACAAIYAPEIASGIYDKEPFVQSIQKLGIDFPKLVVDCVSDGTTFIAKRYR